MDNQPTMLSRKRGNAQRVKMAVILGALISFGPLSLDMYLPGLPALAEDLNTSASLTQLSLTFCLLGLSFGQLAAGPLSDIYGRRKPILIGLVVFIISSVLCALSTSIGMLLVLRLLQGLAGATCIVGARATARDLYSGTELTKFMALLAIFHGAGPIIAPVIGGQLMYVTTWNGIFYVLAAIGVLFLVTAGMNLTETLEPSGRISGKLKNTFSIYRRLLLDRSFMGFSLAQGMITGGMFAYISGSSFVLQKIYGNGVLLGDHSEHGWGIKYTTEFHMTNDSKLFPPRPKWEEKGYLPDEYGHWLRGPWRDYQGSKNVLDREHGVVLSRDGTQALHLEQIEDVALPLYEGRMIGQFDFSEKGWVSGTGRSAVWRDIPFQEKVIEPQYLMGLNSYVEAVDKNGKPKSVRGLKPCYMDVSSATNSRTMISSGVWDVPCGNKVPLLLPRGGALPAISLQTCLNSFVFDFAMRSRLGGLTINYFIVEECPLPHQALIPQEIIAKAFSLLAANSPTLSAAKDSLGFELGHAAITEHERLRLRVIIDATMFGLCSLSLEDVAHILKDCDRPIGDLSGDSAKKLNPKGFWRLGKGTDPELRHTVLSLVAFCDLQEKGLDAFLAQNGGDGWMIPDNLRLADYGLGHDERAQQSLSVASRLGPRFYDWQLNEDLERSWQECADHAELIRRIVPLPSPDETLTIAEPSANYDTQGSQGALF